MTSDPAMPPDAVSLERARAVKRAHEDELMALPNVVAVGVGLRQVGGQLTRQAAIIVSVTCKVPPDELDPADRLPAEIEGVPVDVQQTGPLTAGGS